MPNNLKQQKESLKIEKYLTDLFGSDYPAFVKQCLANTVDFDSALKLKIAMTYQPATTEKYDQLLDYLLTGCANKEVAFKRGFTQAVFNRNHPGVAWAMKHQRDKRGGDERVVLAHFMDYAIQSDTVNASVNGYSCILEILENLPKNGIKINWKKLNENVIESSLAIITTIKSTSIRPSWTENCPKREIKN